MPDNIHLIHTDSIHRAVYATDASAYRELPFAVAYPKDTADIRQLIDHARHVGIRLIPRAGGTSLADLAATLNAIDGIKAIVTNDNRIEISAESAEIEFSFANDTSGVLAALGVNTFFTGTDAKTIGVNQLMYDDPSKFAASGTGVGADTRNGERLAGMPETPLKSLNNQSITQYYRSIYDATTQKAGTVRAMAAGDATYYASLETQKQSISGVNLDEETINLLTFQRAYQASARYVTVINEMLYSLLNM
jgi:flagellar hook-associated protein 1 FlgK